MRLVAAYCVALALGCGGSMPPMPTPAEERAAVNYVWAYALQRSDAAPPVAWLPGPCLAESPRGTCWDGTFDGERVRVAWHGDIPGSALTHELMHAWQWRARHQDDPHHLDPMWATEARINDWLERQISGE